MINPYFTFTTDNKNLCCYKTSAILNINFYTDPNVKPNAKQKQKQRYNEETKVWETYDNVDGKWKKTLLVLSNTKAGTINPTRKRRSSTIFRS